MNCEQLKKDQKLVEEYIRRMGSDRTNDDIAPIADGVVDPESYLSSALRIPGY